MNESEYFFCRHPAYKTITKLLSQWLLKDCIPGLQDLLYTRELFLSKSVKSGQKWNLLHTPQCCCTGLQVRYGCSEEGVTNCLYDRLVVIDFTSEKSPFPVRERKTRKTDE